MAQITNAVRSMCATAVRKYEDEKFAPLVIGSDRFSYFEVARRTGMPAGRSAHMVTKIAKDHDAKSVKDLYKRSSPHSVAQANFGETGLLMLFRLFESEGLSSHHWARKGEFWQNRFTSFYTYKRKDAQERKRLKAAMRKRHPGKIMHLPVAV